MTEQPKYCKINVDKFKWEKIDTLPYLLGLIEFPEDYEYFDEIKHVLDIPKPPKSLEEFKQELDSKFVDLLVKTKRKFAVSKESAKYKFKLKCDQANSRFEYAKTYGEFPQYLSLTTSSNVRIDDSNVFNSYLSVSNSALSWGTEFHLNPSKNSVGYYFVEPDVKFHMTKRPNRIVRFFMRNLLNFKWVDKK
jgi:hypothetical protein